MNIEGMSNIILDIIWDWLPDNMSFPHLLHSIQAFLQREENEKPLGVSL